MSNKPSHIAYVISEPKEDSDHIVFTKAIEFTDFPVEAITLWFANNTIFLPSEY